ncbi:MAG: UDP-3-O-acyl-N-acetylglucosamine deacetylase [Candidatus Zipacnadales bacterium]
MAYPRPMGRRRTVARSAQLRGTALLSGQPVTVTVRPAESGRGIVFRHLPSDTCLPASLDCVREVPQCTSLQLGEAKIDFIEHLMAVLAANGITDVVLEVSGDEVPLQDGSARPYQAMLDQAGVAELPEVVEPLVLSEMLAIVENDRGLFALPGKPQWWYLLDHPHPLIGRQAACYDPLQDDFTTAVAPARTFATEEEARALIAKRGLRGAEEKMAIVAYANRLSAPEPFPNSFAMHKLLDLLGDLYLLGRPILGRIIAHRTGHVDNRALARRIGEVYVK